MTKHGWLFMNTNFIANDPSKHNSTNSKTINIFLFNPEICRTLCFLSKTCQFFFITGMDSLITKRKIVDLSIQSIFFPYYQLNVFWNISETQWIWMVLFQTQAAIGGVLQACNVIEKETLWHRCFPVNFVKLLRTPFYRTPPGDCFCFRIFCFELIDF